MTFAEKPHVLEKDPGTRLYLRPQAIYVSARAAHGLEPIRAIYRRRLEKLAHTITYAWADEEGVRKPYRDPVSRLANLAIQDAMLRGAAAADVCILLADDGLHGALMESGAFLYSCLDRPDGRIGYIVGANSRQSIFDSPEYVRFVDDIEQVYKELGFLGDEPAE